MHEHEVGLADSLLRLAQSYLDVGDFAKAEPLLEETETIFASGSATTLAEAVLLNSLGVAYRRVGKRALMVRYAMQAAYVAQRAVGERHAVYARILQNLGATLRDAGSYAEAERALKRCLEVTEGLVPRSPADVGACQFSLGLLYTDTRDYEADGRCCSRLRI